MRVRRKVRDIEARLTNLEARLNPREWDTPPRPQVPMPDLPTLHDYTPGAALDDETWNPHGYL